MTLNSLKNGDSTENGILLSGLGSAFSFFGIISIGNAGADLKKASAKIRNENFWQYLIKITIKILRGCKND